MQGSTEQPGASDLGPLAVDGREILHAIRRRKWLILASALIVGAAVAAGTSRQPKIYSATAQIIVEPVLPKIIEGQVGVDGLSEQGRAEREFLNTQYKIIKSRGVMREAAARLGLATDESFLRAHGLSGLTGEDLEKAIDDKLNRLVTVAPEINSRIVRLVVEDQDPARAARIANVVAQAYIDESLEKRLSSSQSASHWLDERVSEFASKLEAAERALYDFKKANVLVSVSLEDRQNMTAATLSKLTQELVDTRTALIDLEAKRGVVTAELARPNGSIEAVPKVSDKSLLQDMRQNLANLEKQRVELNERYGPRHPNMVALENQIAEARQHLEGERRLVLQTLDNEIATLKAAEAGLNQAMEREKTKALELNNLGLDYSKLTRDLGTVKNMYETLLKRQTEADLSGLLKSNFVRWLETAELQTAPIRPSMSKNTAIGLLVGLLLGLLITIGGVLLDNTVHTQMDVEETLRLPFLGVLPSIEEEEEARKAGGVAATGDGKIPIGHRDLYIVRNPKSSIAECARSIRTNLMFLGTEKPLKTLLMTSAGPAEGKSTTAIALGITMAQAGAKILLIDTDLRRPRLHRTFGVSGDRGLTSLLLDETSLEEAIKATEVLGLDLLPCGPLPPNPAELLHTERFQTILKQLGERYDRIILDSPPVNAVTDAVILSKTVDGTLLVVKASKTAKEAVRRAARMLRDVDAKILGAVLNDLDLEAGAYAYQYYYHRYGYAYGSENEKRAEA